LVTEQQRTTKPQFRSYLLTKIEQISLAPNSVIELGRVKRRSIEFSADRQFEDLRPFLKQDLPQVLARMSPNNRGQSQWRKPKLGYPQRVTSSGGRYQFKDDWQFYDTLVTSFEYEDKMISWEGKSCQGMKFYGRDRGSTIMGTTGTVLVDRGGYEIYDLKGNKTSEFKAGNTSSSADLIGSDSMTDAHFANFIAGIRKGEKLNAPIAVGNVAVTMLQLSNVAWEVNRELHLDTKDGRIQGDPEAMKMWGREYEKGWAPHV
jgi:hypothetical protein